MNLAAEIVTKSFADHQETLVSSKLYNAVKNVLVLLGEFLEVPFIWTYKKDLIPVILKQLFFHVPICGTFLISNITLESLLK